MFKEMINKQGTWKLFMLDVVGQIDRYDKDIYLFVFVVALITY